VRDLLLRQTAFDALQQAQAGAIAAIGMRGSKARKAMRAGIRQKSELQRARREDGILRGAVATRFNAVTVDESNYDSALYRRPEAARHAG
jgi:hypothetical protein